MGKPRPLWQRVDHLCRSITCEIPVAIRAEIAQTQNLSLARGRLGAWERRTKCTLSAIYDILPSLPVPGAFLNIDDNVSGTYIGNNAPICPFVCLPSHWNINIAMMTGPLGQQDNVLPLHICQDMEAAWKNITYTSIKHIHFLASEKKSGFVR